MPKGYQYPPALVAAIRGHAQDGSTMREAAEELGLSYWAIRRWCSRHRLRFGAKPPRPDPAPLRAVVAALYAGYTGSYQIGRVVGRDAGLVRCWLRDLIRLKAVRRVGKYKGTKYTPVGKGEPGAWPDPGPPFRLPPPLGRRGQRGKTCPTERGG